MSSNRIFEGSDGLYGGKAEYVYANPADIFVTLTDPKDLNLIAGRATGKTTGIVARRMLRINKSMPGAYLAFTGDFYSNLLSNTVPSMLKGWEDMGLEQGKDFVINERPPAHFDKPYKRPISYKHTVSFFNGCFYKLASMDVVSSMAGDSYQHILGDEAKYLDKSKLDKLLPAKRGERMRFEGSPYYLGTTFTTDMPNALSGNEYDWMLEMEANMDIEQIKALLYAALTVNDIKKALVNAVINRDNSEFDKQQRLYLRWNERLYRARKNSVLFHVISSFANADILTLDWFKDQLDLSGIEGFKSSILSMRPEISPGEKFYPQFSEVHIYDDGLLESFYDTVNFGEVRRLDCRGLRYIQRDKPLSGSVDFGKMMGLIIGQRQGWYERILKTHYALGKNNLEKLAQDFVEFYQFHGRKHLRLWHDRSGNQNRSMGYDFATRLKELIEGAEINGVRQGWKVELMSQHQGTIYQFEEYNLANQMFSETNPRLPRIRIDRYQCVELVSSLNLAKQIIKQDKHGNNKLHKDKTSEKLPLNSLPMNSTNMSDAFKYYICRPEYMNEVQERGISSGSYAPMIHNI